jgi:hypothetical protein
MDFEGAHTRDLLTLAQRALQGDNIDKGMLCTAAIKVIDNPPRDGILRSLADHVCQPFSTGLASKAHVHGSRVSSKATR